MIKNTHILLFLVGSIISGVATFYIIQYIEKQRGTTTTTQPGTTQPNLSNNSFLNSGK